MVVEALDVGEVADDRPLGDLSWTRSIALRRPAHRDPLPWLWAREADVPVVPGGAIKLQWEMLLEALQVGVSALGSQEKQAEL